MAVMEFERGVPIRAVSRALSVLQAVNRGRSLTMTEVARASGIPYPTACRIVHSLVHDGMIEQEPDRKRYRPTALVESLAHGFQGHGALVQAARPHMRALTRDIGWPLSLTTHVGSSMVLRDSTHAQTSLTFNAYFPGYAMPILGCAAGLAYLAQVDDAEREGILSTLRHDANSETRDMLSVLDGGELLETVRKSGYAARDFNRFTENPGKTSSIAIAVVDGDKVIGALAVAFFASALKLERAIEQLLPRLQACAIAINSDLHADRAALPMAR